MKRYWQSESYRYSRAHPGPKKRRFGKQVEVKSTHNTNWPSSHQKVNRRQAKQANWEQVNVTDARLWNYVRKPKVVEAARQSLQCISQLPPGSFTVTVGFALATKDWKMPPHGLDFTSERRVINTK